MRRLLIPLILLVSGGLACRQPVPAPQPVARVVIRFLDRDAVLALPSQPPEGTWHLMNAGQWEPLDLCWKAGNPQVGVTVVGRTAPDWVMLEDPSGESHRVVMRGPGPEALARRNERLDPDEVEALTVMGILWALAWARH
jgi:hypothetical protein